MHTLGIKEFTSGQLSQNINHCYYLWRSFHCIEVINSIRSDLQNNFLMQWVRKVYWPELIRLTETNEYNRLMASHGKLNSILKDSNLYFFRFLFISMRVEFSKIFYYILQKNGLSLQQF